MTNDEIEELAFMITDDLKSHGTIGYSATIFDYVRNRVTQAIKKYGRGDIPSAIPPPPTIRRDDRNV